jgi:hypothetical protein
MMDNSIKNEVLVCVAVQFEILKEIRNEKICDNEFIPLAPSYERNSFI